MTCSAVSRPPKVPGGAVAAGSSPDTASRPVLDWYALDIPRPPSINRFKGKLGNRSPCVVRWRAQADRHLLANGRYPRIKGEYEIVVIFPNAQFGKYDAENFMKALSDWLQSRELVENDRLARSLFITWGDAPSGCRVHIRPWVRA